MWKELMAAWGADSYTEPAAKEQAFVIELRADLMADLALPVVLVVGLRLGCLNHAILTAEAVVARGLRLVGWVGNTTDPAMPHLSDNVRTLTHELQRRHQVPCWGIVPHLSPPDAASIARFFHADVLQAHFGPLHAQAVSSV